VRRFHHVILILIGRAPYAYSTERMEFEMALDKFTAAAAELTDAANRLITHCKDHEGQVAQLTADLAQADETATAAIQPTIDALNAAAPPA
jgi:hypothetical protein